MNGNDNVFVPTDTTVGLMGTYPVRSPNVCPGCGRCKECGQPTPYVPYAVPYMPSYPYPGVIYGGTVGPNSGVVLTNTQQK